MTDLHDTAEVLSALLPADMDDFLRRNPTPAEKIIAIEQKIKETSREHPPILD